MSVKNGLKDAYPLFYPFKKGQIFLFYQYSTCLLFIPRTQKVQSLLLSFFLYLTLSIYSFMF